MKRTIEEQLGTNDRCVVRTVGCSMEPMLHENSSSVVLKKPLSPLRKWDVVLFRRPDGQLVMHRIVNARQACCMVCGDNSLSLEKVRMRDVLGVVEGFFPDTGDRYIAAGTPEYAAYSKHWWIRYGSRYCCGMVKRIIRRLRMHHI